MWIFQVATIIHNTLSVLLFVKSTSRDRRFIFNYGELIGFAERYSIDVEPEFHYFVIESESLWIIITLNSHTTFFSCWTPWTSYYIQYTRVTIFLMFQEKGLAQPLTCKVFWLELSEFYKLHMEIPHYTVLTILE